MSNYDTPMNIDNFNTEYIEGIKEACELIDHIHLIESQHHKHIFSIIDDFHCTYLFSKKNMLEVRISGISYLENDEIKRAIENAIKIHPTEIRILFPKLNS